MVMTGPVRRGFGSSPETRRDEERHDHYRTAREVPGCPHRRPVLPAPDALASRVNCGGDEGRSTTAGPDGPAVTLSPTESDSVCEPDSRVSTCGGLPSNSRP